ncbi:MAG: M14 metallopeptidase family protein [Cyclobacteriaceae bacterium]
MKLYPCSLGIGLLISILPCLISCSGKSTDQKLNPSLLAQAHEDYKEVQITQKRFGYETIKPLVENRGVEFSVATLGISVEGRPIHSLTYGRGALKVLLWSQMHGDESTATMALFDLFNFFEGPSDDGYGDIRETINSHLTVKFIPMVNPDGAERFQRRNVLGIDLNRDAIRISSPEARILREAREAFDPSFGFNLHDQNPYYNTEGSANPATISVLAPAYNEATDINEVREKAMKIIVGINRILQVEIPGHVGKYNDSFEPRAFGDNFQKWGTSTILIESGGYPNDPEKQYIRKLNFMILLNALYEIATGEYNSYDREAYFSIPDNDSKLMDLIIRDVSLKYEDYTFQTDIGINRKAKESDEGYYYNGVINDLGDLSIYHGYEEVQKSDLEIVMGKVYDGELDWDELNWEKAVELLKEGYIAIKTSEENMGKLHDLPLKVFTGDQDLDPLPSLGSVAHFFLRENRELRYAVINGILVDLRKPEKLPVMGMVE